MSLKIAVLSSLTALGALGAPAADDQARNLGPVGSQEPLPTTVSHRSSAVESKKPEARSAASRRQEER
jgi:hypothetical protein